MNRLAISYAWNCSHVKDGVELIDTYALALLLAVAYRIPSRSRYETEPTTLAELCEMTRMKDRHLRDRRDLLARLGELAEGGQDAPNHADPGNARPWSKRAIYQLPGLAGPLFIVTPWDVDLSAAQLAVLRAQGSRRGSKSARRADLRPGDSAPRADFRGQNAAHRAGQSRHTAPTFGANAGGLYFPTSVVRRTDHHDDDRFDAPPIVNDAVHVVAEDLFDWMVEESPKHTGGALLTDRAKALPLLVELLATNRPVEKLKAMVIKLWTCTPDEPGCRWIAQTDRSLRVLWEARDTLDQVVSRGRRSTAAPRACRFRHDPPCASTVECYDRERQLVAERDRGAEVAR